VFLSRDPCRAPTHTAQLLLLVKSGTVNMKGILVSNPIEKPELTDPVGFGVLKKPYLEQKHASQKNRLSAILGTSRKRSTARRHADVPRHPNALG